MSLHIKFKIQGLNYVFKNFFSIFCLASPAVGTEDPTVNKTDSVPTDENIQSFEKETNTERRNKNTMGGFKKKSYEGK